MTVHTDLIPGLDATYLELEHPGLPMHIGSVAVFQGGPLRDARGRIRIGDLRRHIATRLDLLPRFRQVAVPAPLRPGRWMWVDHPGFDIAEHVRVASVPPPGDEAALLRRCADLHAELLPRDRPLWQLYLVDGLDDGNVALIEKIHHTLVDGVAGVDVTAILMDSEPHSLDEVGRPARWRPEPAPTVLDSARELVASGVRTAGRTMGSLARPATALRNAMATTRFLPVLNQLTTRAPRTSLNRSVGARRQLAAVRRPLAALKAAGHAEGGTVNDVILAVVAGGLRALLEERGEDPDQTLRALVPVSLRPEEQRGDVGNRTGALFVDLPCAIPTTRERIPWIAARTAAQKASGFAAASEELLTGADLLAPMVDRVASAVVHHQPFVNLVITNVPGPSEPIYVGGALMLDAVPIVPLAGNLTVGIAVLSYAGTVAIGIDADESAVVDLPVFVRGIEDAFDEVLNVAVVPAAASS
jgi:diacylglycerol O-acyltransferase